MSLTDGSGLSASDVLALTANNNDGFGGNGFGGGWWLILFIIMMFGGWGNWGNAGAGNMAVPYMLGQNSEVQRGFDQSAVMNGLNNLSMAVANGFAAQSVDSCNKAMTIMQGQNGILQQMANDRFNTITTLNGGHNAILQQMGNYEMARQQCCCDNKAAIADLKYTVATENCADRTALDTAVWNLSRQMSDGFQKIIDMNKDQRIADLERQLNQQNLAAKSIMDIIGEIPQDAQDSYSNGVTGSYSLRPGFKYEYPGHMPEYSYRRGRSAETGRYVSRGHDRFYSGHSIYDILIANMELTYGDCKSEHDEKIIDTAIRMVNQNR